MSCPLMTEADACSVADSKTIIMISLGVGYRLSAIGQLTIRQFLNEPAEPPTSRPRCSFDPINPF